ncbi:MAG: TM2 domain-containing protein [Defluviitaleaceae bacterium]|nr:TM2 domain-containing protein [Defluviitaleaceae bacterium]
MNEHNTSPPAVAPPPPGYSPHPAPPTGFPPIYTPPPMPSQYYSQVGVGRRSKMACGLAALFLGWLGVHKFMLGYTNQGVMILIASIVTTVGIILSWPLLMIGVGIIMKLIFYPAGLILMVLGIIDGIKIFTSKNFRDADGYFLR